MWDAKTEIREAGRVHRVRILCGEKPVPYAEIVERWQTDRTFRSFFTGVLANVPLRAFLWETPPITTASATRPFECVFVGAPALTGQKPDRITFASHFEAAGAAADAVHFANLGGDAQLVAPVPKAPLRSYTHLAAFARAAPAEQQHALWRMVGSAVADHLSDRPLWLSTNGLGVAWLHVRLDTRPKYYSFAAYLKHD